MMNSSRKIVIAFSLSLCLAFVACGGGGGSAGGIFEVEVEVNPPAPEFTYHVDATFGSDWNPGTELHPLRTISAALLEALPGDSVKVAPGLYDSVHGESFPIQVPAGVTVIGGEDPASIEETVIYGSGMTFVPGYAAAVQLYSSSSLTGFLVQNSVWTNGPTKQVGILVTGDDACIVDNVVFYNQFAGIYCDPNSENLWILNNTVVGSREGMVFRNNTSAVVEGNVIQGNTIGLVIYKSDVNLGGAPGCNGGNLFTQNKQSDIHVVAGFLLVFAKNNYWDQFPPVAGVNYFKPSSSNVLTDGAKHSGEYLF